MKAEETIDQQAYVLLGGGSGVRMLANHFYDVMSEIPNARKIRDMHPEDLSETRENLTLFLCGWLGGPPLYQEKYGRINLSELHAHLPIGNEEKDVWLRCMELALKRQNVEENLKSYLMKRFEVPAERIRIICQQHTPGLPIIRYKG